jgi:hypothetical protein
MMIDSKRDERRSAVMALAEAEGRTALAEHLAATTDFPVSAIAEILATAPRPSKPELRVDLAADMRRRHASCNQPADAPARRAALRVDLAADMRRRHGMEG